MSHSEQCKSSFQGFVRAHGTYNRYRRTLKRIYQETLELYSGCPCGVKTSEYLDLDKKKLSLNEGALLRNTIQNTLSIVIIGQSYKSKCQFANTLFGLDILPVSSPTWLHQSRITKFKHGTRPQLSISLQDSFVIIEPRLQTSAHEDRVNWAQEFNLLEDDLKKIDGAIVEITLHHPILRGAQVVICGGNESLSDVLYEKKHRKQEGFSSCMEGASPIFIYTFEDQVITPKEHWNLTAFFKQYPDCGVAFCSLGKADCSEEAENQAPSKSISDPPYPDSCLSCCKEHCRSQTRSSKRPKDCSILSTLGADSSVEGKNLSDKQTNTADLCNNKISRTFQELITNPSWCGKPGRAVTAVTRPPPVAKSCMTTSDNCVYHGQLSESSLELIKDLLSIGYQFTCNCKGQFAQPKENYAKISNYDTHGWESSSEESDTPDSCFQSNPSYTALNGCVFEDSRLRGFPPSSVYIPSCMQPEKFHHRILSFIRSVAKYYLVRAAKVLHRLHTSILDNSIRYAFQMSRDLMITPRRVEYARQQESQLFFQLVEISNKKQTEMQELISGIKAELRENILNAAESYNIPDDEGTFRQVTIIKREIQDLVLQHVRTSTAERLYDSIQVLRESYIGTLSRCLECLEASVEKESHQEAEGATSKHFKKIVHAAYNVELSIQSSSSLARIMIDKLRQLLSNLPWHEPPIMDRAWRRNVASDVLASLDDSRLAKSICTQFRSRLHQSHSAFLTSLRQLESSHTCRLEHTEENRHKVAKIVAPHVARLALESTSMIDSVLFGMPRMGREIGRGMYGVVYQCDTWSTWSPCAVKSVAPPDEKHANDLSLEFYYTRSLPEHPRIVQIRGSIIDESYAGGVGPPAVLLIMDRMHCDLYTSIKRGLNECNRMQVAVDVVEGIRFLHSQGLVHRDIKLKNVLLDRKHRAKITDLGFCKPGAMISGSIVGTPVHMPPELFSGKYDCSVDVYAFGVLLWYLCAGVTRLPRNFETCTTKDHLWTAVRKGVRPERLPMFTDETWQLMRACWHSDPAKRPLLGRIQPKLIDIHSRLNK